MRNLAHLSDVIHMYEHQLDNNDLMYIKKHVHMTDIPFV